MSVCITVAGVNAHATALAKDFSQYDSVHVGVVSDTHGYIDPHVCQRLRKCRLILHAGDIGSAQVISQLRAIGDEVVLVRGNNDVPVKWPSSEHVELATLHEVEEIKLPGGSVILTHGDQFDAAANRHVRLRQCFPYARAVVYGHTHRLVCDQHAVPWVLNPGAAGKVRTGGGASCLLMVAAKDGWELSEFRATNAP